MRAVVACPVLRVGWELCKAAGGKVEGPESPDQLCSAIYFDVPPAVANFVGVRGRLSSCVTRQRVGNGSGVGSPC